MRSIWVAGSCLVLIGLFGCQRNRPSADPAPEAGPADLAGRWQLTMPAGAKYEATIEKTADGRFHLERAVRLNGLYEIQGSRLVASGAQAANEGAAWEIRGAGDLVLVAQPSRFREANYVGATLKRIAGTSPDSRPGNNASAPSASGCRIFGQVGCDEYEKRGGSVERSIVSVFQEPGRRRVANATSQGSRFEVHLGAGAYQVQCSAIGSRGATFTPATRQITIQEGQKDLDLGRIDLPASVTTRLYGQPAPELAGVAGWKNTEPLTLSGLRGKVVVLYFWAYFDGVSQAGMQNLERLQKKHEGLAVLLVHNNSVATIDEMNQKLKGMKNVWKKELTLPTALDGKGPQSVFRAYGILAVPAAILIAPDGRIVRRFPNAVDPLLESEVQRLLQK